MQYFEYGEHIFLVLGDMACLNRPIDQVSLTLPAIISNRNPSCGLSQYFIAQYLFHPCMYIQESPSLCFLCRFCLVLGRSLSLCFFVVWWHPFMLETLQKIAQADLCTSCMNGGSTRAKKAKSLNFFHCSSTAFGGQVHSTDRMTRYWKISRLWRLSVKCYQRYRDWLRSKNV